MGSASAPTTGDLILLDYQGRDLRHLDSWLIKAGTRSPYSHMLVVLDEGHVAQANPAPGPRADRPPPTGDNVGDIQIYELGRYLNGLGASDAKIRLDLFHPLKRAVDSGRVTAFAEHERQVAKQHAYGKTERDQVVFSTGHSIAIGVIHAIQAHPRLVPEADRWVDALVWAMGDGDRWLFCSEFAYRCLKAGGADFALRRKPIVDLSRYGVIGLNVMAWPVPTPAEVWRLLVARAKALMNWDADDDRGTEELWKCVQEGFDERCRPTNVSAADFCVPADFACSPDFERTATYGPGSTSWQPAEPYDCG